eukprot:scaffold127_cov309-Prasinococcus_capsulatus_cf.AAC.1
MEWHGMGCVHPIAPIPLPRQPARHLSAPRRMDAPARGGARTAQRPALASRAGRPAGGAYTECVHRSLARSIEAALERARRRRAAAQRRAAPRARRLQLVRLGSSDHPATRSMGADASKPLPPEWLQAAEVALLVGKAQYTAGEAVEGSLQLAASARVPICNAFVTLESAVRTKVHYTTRHTRHTGGGTPRPSTPRRGAARALPRSMRSDVLACWSAGRSHTVVRHHVAKQYRPLLRLECHVGAFDGHAAPGVYALPFRIDLPRDLPSSALLGRRRQTSERTNERAGGAVVADADAAAAAVAGDAPRGRGVAGSSYDSGLLVSHTLTAWVEARGFAQRVPIRIAHLDVMAAVTVVPRNLFVDARARVRTCCCVPRGDVQLSACLDSTLYLAGTSGVLSYQVRPCNATPHNATPRRPANRPTDDDDDDAAPPKSSSSNTGNARLSLAAAAAAARPAMRGCRWQQQQQQRHCEAVASSSGLWSHAGASSKASSRGLAAGRLLAGTRACKRARACLTGRLLACLLVCLLACLLACLRAWLRALGQVLNESSVAISTITVKLKQHVWFSANGRSKSLDETVLGLAVPVDCRGAHAAVVALLWS